MKYIVGLLLLLAGCNASSNDRAMVSSVIVTPAPTASITTTIPIEYSALAIPATDWFPPNPYCGKTASDFAFPIPPQCPAGEYINLAGACAQNARNNYINNMISLSNSCCAAYQAKVDQFQTIMDHYAFMLQGCLNDCFQNEACEAACWELNQIVSANLFAQYDAAITSINNAYDIMASIYKDMYATELLNCCEPLPEKIRR